MAGEKSVETTGLLGWIDRRFPLTSTYKAQLSKPMAVMVVVEVLVLPQPTTPL